MNVFGKNVEKPPKLARKTSESNATDGEKSTPERGQTFNPQLNVMR
jgi:hypothetical protein